MNKIRFAKRTACFLTAGMMILSAGVLTGCGKKDDARGNAIVDQQEAMKTLAYDVKDVSVDAEIDRTVVYKNGLFYGLNSLYELKGSEEDGNYFSTYSIVVFDENGEITQTIPVYEQTEPNEYGGVSGGIFISDEGNITCMMYKGSYDEETGEDSYSNELVTFDSAGNIISTIDTSNIVSEQESNEEQMWLQDFLVDGQGNIYFNLNKCVRVCDSAGKVLFTTEKLSGDNAWSNGMILTNGGVPAFSVYDYSGEESKFLIKEIDINAKGYGAEYDLSGINVGSMYSGSGDYLTYFTTDTGISGVRADTLAQEQVINLLNLGVDNTNINGFCTTDSGGFVTVSRDYGKYGNSKTTLNVLSPVDGSQVKEKKILSLGCFYMDWRMRSQIAEFNKTNGEYVIYATSYSESNDTSDWEAALTKFNNEILAGNVPDILLINDNMPYDSYASKGMFADLYELIESDGEYTKDSFVPSVLKGLEKDGKLYCMAMGFTVQTFAAKKSKVGAEQSITMDKANELLSAMPGAVLFNNEEYMNSSEYLGTALQFLSFADYSTASCSFDSDDFKAVLEKAKEYPAEIDYEALWNDNPNYWQEQETACKEDRALLYNMYLSDFGSYSSTRDAYFGEDITLVGYPGISAENPGGAYISFNTKIAVSGKSQFKEAAWEFIKNIIKGAVTEEEVENYSSYMRNSSMSSVSGSEDAGTKKRWVSNYYSFPVLKEQLELLGKDSTIPDTYIDENGNEVESENIWYVGDEQIKVKKPTQADVDLVIDYVSNVENVYSYDTSLLEIINEDAQEYFNGTKSVDETASIIQSRAKIYLSEQY
ncbi:MAG: hypothetical protein NC120_07980 [Ruminococcus sp.]|nr:hypothetical protein [Ruminococcus sp.]